MLGKEQREAGQKGTEDRKKERRETCWVLLLGFLFGFVESPLMNIYAIRFKCHCKLRHLFITLNSIIQFFQTYLSIQFLIP